MNKNLWFVHLLKLLKFTLKYIFYKIIWHITKYVLFKGFFYNGLYMEL